jgi:hypothetical protein
VDRNGVGGPAALTALDGLGARELKAAEKAITQGKSPKFTAYTHEEVKLALEQLFHGKCAYCESFYAGQAPVDVEHYRPKGRILGEDDHPGYWWLAMAWANLLPSCIDCNRRRWQKLPKSPSRMLELFLAPEIEGGLAKLGKQDLFPISGSRAGSKDADLDLEQALLLNPTLDDAEAHLKYYFGETEPLSLIVPRTIRGKPSPRGLMSIHVYGLNRLGLVQERTRLVKRLEFMCTLVEELEDVKRRLEKSHQQRMVSRMQLLIDLIIEEFGRMADDDQPFCSMVRAWLKR